jgi:uncharacterized protein YcaQ
MPLDLDALRRHAVARTLFPPTTLLRAIERLGFVQADPIRAPARAQDLVLRHRVRDYRAGELERRYPRLPLEEDFFVNYGFLPRTTAGWMHPREPHPPWDRSREARASAVLDFVRQRGRVHPAEVDAHFQHGRTRNWFGGSSRASTQLLDAMHYRGLLRIARRDRGVRVYALRTATPTPADAAQSQARHDALVDVAVAAYAPLPAATLGQLLSHLGAGVPQWRSQRGAALDRARKRLPSTRIGGVAWFWPAGDAPGPASRDADDRLRLLAPFDPIVWDRRRFALFWGWDYRFEAYTPAPQRKLGYYAMPMLWRGQVIGWGNLAWRDGRLDAQLGYVAGRAPRGAAYRTALDDELQRFESFMTPG